METSGPATTSTNRHALSWIAEHGRFLRQMSVDLLRRKLERPKGTCTWCGGSLPKYRRSWCSEACSTEAFIRCRPQSAAYAVFQRDRGICAICDENTVETAGLVNSIILSVRQFGGCLLAPVNAARLNQQLTDLYGPNSSWNVSWKVHKRRRNSLCHCLACELTREYAPDRDPPWNADHRLAVVEGGGMCGLEGYRTLCIRCHKAESKLLAGRRKKAPSRPCPPATASSTVPSSPSGPLPSGAA